MNYDLGMKAEAIARIGGLWTADNAAISMRYDGTFPPVINVDGIQIDSKKYGLEGIKEAVLVLTAHFHTPVPTGFNIPNQPLINKCLTDKRTMAGFISKGRRCEGDWWFKREYVTQPSGLNTRPDIQADQT